MDDLIPHQVRRDPHQATEHVVIPGGAVPRRHVVRVEPGQILHHGTEGVPWQTSGLAVPRSRGRGQSRSLGQHWLGGWGCLYRGNDSLARFGLTWEVPKAPSVRCGQTLMLTAGLENADFGHSLTTAVTWERSGGRYGWHLTSWLICDEWAASSRSVPVMPGDQVRAVAELDQSGSQPVYRFGFEGHPETALVLAGGPDLVWANAGLQFHGDPAGVAQPGRTVDAHLAGVSSVKASDLELDPPINPSDWSFIRSRGVGGRDVRFALTPGIVLAA